MPVAPWLLSTIAEYIGNAPAARLAEALHGREVKIPTRRKGAAWDRLCAAIGEAAAGTLQEAFSGETIYVSGTMREAVRYNRSQVVKLKAQGLTNAQIADRIKKPLTRYSDRGIRKMAAAHRADAQQGSLFGLERTAPVPRDK